MTGIAKRLLGTTSILLLIALDAHSERLPVKTYTTADGLPSNVVNRVVPDSRGFLWFCTREGLSRFDGYNFTTYGIDQGLPSALVESLLETHDGTYWIATAGGLCRFNPSGSPASGSINSAEQSNKAPMFITYSTGTDVESRYILSLFEDREGTIWCGTSNGIFSIKNINGEVKISPVDFGIPHYLESNVIRCFLEDRNGALWVGTGNGLYRRSQDGKIDGFRSPEGLPTNVIQSLFEDRKGQIWVGTRSFGVCLLSADPKSGRNSVAHRYYVKDGFVSGWINDMFQSSDGEVWAATPDGLIRWVTDADGKNYRFRRFSELEGLSTHEVLSIAEDQAGNLWLATVMGVAKIPRSGLTLFGKADGLAWSTTPFQTMSGDFIVAGSSVDRTLALNRFDGEKFIPIQLRLPESVTVTGRTWGWDQTVVEDHTGDYWIATRGGVVRFDKVSKPEQLQHAAPKAIYGIQDGLSSTVVLRLFEDSRGDIWIGTVGEGASAHGLSRWERRTGTFHHYIARDGIPSLESFYVSAFAEDHSGNLWIGFSSEGGLVRYRDGVFKRFTVADGFPPGQIRSLFVDSNGGLWVANYRAGLIHIEQPNTENLSLVRYTTSNGLSSNEIRAICEDRSGRLYIGTGRGIDRLDLKSQYIKHYTAADGLPLAEMQAAFSDRQGELWFSYQTGLVRLVPQIDESFAPPPIVISALRVGGEQLQISALGEKQVAPIELASDKNQIQVDFVGLAFGPGERLLYQYLLEGSGQDWSTPADQRSVNFANLAPGKYRFVVRATNTDGMVSSSPASVSFTVLPPFWRTWWFITLAALVMWVVIYATYRYRVSRLLELERVRTRIAADLHDDIGSSLSQIAVLSEVLRQKAGGDDSRFATPLSQIAHVSRETIDSMSDIVWAINPQKDHLHDLAQRMRRHASEVFPASGIQFTFHAAEASRDLSLGADLRRQIFLIFKESVNNIVRHSRCERAEIDLRVEGSTIVLSVKDNGIGFDDSNGIGGNGLASMRRRTASLGGEFHLSSRHGTTLTVRLPHGGNRL